MPTAPIRDYTALLAKIRAMPVPDDCTEAMKLAVDLIWNAFGLDTEPAPRTPDLRSAEGPGSGPRSSSSTGPRHAPTPGTNPRAPRLSWIGFYEKVANADEMVLLERQPKPACSPIGLHGACGQAWKLQRPLVIPDVKTLGEHYIACDPRDQSELVIPLFCPGSSCTTEPSGAGFQPASPPPTSPRGAGVPPASPPSTSPPTPQPRGTGMLPVSPPSTPPLAPTPPLHCWGVLDADSYEPNAFDANDVAGLTTVLELLGLTSNTRPGVVVR